ncbi:hypothetical protein BDP81DRAFT_398235 [Colletotrichum phormii]|uniref:Uncharacterized protein n=1 Tax=Colletotrichum phormii TaxID=359342 RepID=A0AAJ0ECF7_9PEZI|nr:uncharacterized protein BDP81DRAFT_398235 [Colletotrichum phormii]KAK1624587.1 hypothetical protein BDP81DRAFT_398235 [Colletotrichum phormii]
MGLETDLSNSDKMVLSNIVEDLGKGAYPAISEVLEDMVQATVQQSNHGVMIPSATPISDHALFVPPYDNGMKYITAGVDKLQVQYELLSERLSLFEKKLSTAEKKRKKLVRVSSAIERNIEASKAEVQSLDIKVLCGGIKDRDLELLLEMETSELWGAKTRRNMQMKKIDKKLNEIDRFIEAHEAIAAATTTGSKT